MYYTFDEWENSTVLLQAKEYCYFQVYPNVHRSTVYNSQDMEAS